jgi:hypothetical protein
MTSGRYQGLAGHDSRNLAATIRQILAGITAHSVGIPIVCVLTRPGPGAAVGSPIVLRCEISYSITSSALTSSVTGTVRPSVFAVAVLITSWNLVGWITGKSAGLSPLRTRPVYRPARR